MINRDKVLAYAKSYWWRPCKDGKVWIASEPINLAKEAKDRKKEDYVAVFLWYPAKGNKNANNSYDGMWETLALVPPAKAKEIEGTKDDDDRLWSKYASDGIALASWKDDPKDSLENLGAFPTKPPYFGLNDCTHFTSECLIAGGFPITNDKARRGAGDLADYLDASKDTATLCFMASQEDVKAVVDAGVVREGDVFAYHEDVKHYYAHHTVPAVNSRGGVAMHTWRGFDRPWGRPWPFDIPGERISLFHFKDDVYTTADAKKWLGWWKVETLGNPKAAKADYYHFSDTGALAVTSQEPKNAKEKPKTAPYRWFSTKAKTAVVVRRNDKETKVETFTLQDPKGKDTSTTADGALSPLPKGSKLSLKGTQLF
jgi:hypothetical protein